MKRYKICTNCGDAHEGMMDVCMSCDSMFAPSPTEVDEDDSFSSFFY